MVPVAIVLVRKTATYSIVPKVLNFIDPSRDVRTARTSRTLFILPLISTHTTGILMFIRLKGIATSNMWTTYLIELSMRLVLVRYMDGRIPYSRQLSRYLLVSKFDTSQNL